MALDHVGLVLPLLLCQQHSFPLEDPRDHSGTLHMNLLMRWCSGPEDTWFCLFEFKQNVVTLVFVSSAQSKGVADPGLSGQVVYRRRYCGHTCDLTIYTCAPGCIMIRSRAREGSDEEQQTGTEPLTIQFKGQLSERLPNQHLTERKARRGKHPDHTSDNCSSRVGGCS